MKTVDTLAVSIQFALQPDGRWYWQLERSTSADPHWLADQLRQIASQLEAPPPRSLRAEA